MIEILPLQDLDVKISGIANFDLIFEKNFITLTIDIKTIDGSR